MRLRRYLAMTNQTCTAFAARTGLSTSTISRLVDGKTFPQAEGCQIIRSASDGLVTPNDLLDEYLGYPDPYSTDAP